MKESNSIFVLFLLRSYYYNSIVVGEGLNGASRLMKGVVVVVVVGWNVNNLRPALYCNTGYMHLLSVRAFDMKLKDTSKKHIMPGFVTITYLDIF